MELFAMLFAMLATPYKAVGRIGHAIFAKALNASIPLDVVHAFNGHQALSDSVCASIVLLPKNWNNNTSYAAVDNFVDMIDYDYVDFYIQIGAIDVSIDAKAQEAVDSAGGTATDITSGGITQVTSTQDNRLVIVSIKKTTMSKRYAGVAINVPSGTTNNIAVLAIRYGKVGNLPVTQEVAGTHKYATAEVVKV